MLDIPWSRLICAFTAGHLLYIAGSLTQIVTINPLASPATLGVNALVVLVILFAQWVSIIFTWEIGLEWVSLLIFAVSFISLALVTFRKNDAVTVFQNRDQKSLDGILLMGLCLNLFVGAIFAVLQFLFMALNWQFPTSLWFGSFYSGNVFVLSISIVSFVLVTLMTSRLSKSLRLLSFGRDFALGLGINISKIQKKVLLLVVGISGVVTCLFGVFAFFGLVMPHLVRKFFVFGQDVKFELRYGPIMGGIFMALLDLACYHWPLQGAELPVGMVSSVVGSLTFLIVLVRKKKSNDPLLAKRN